ncbi:MAG: hypothetical protein ACOC9E_03745 [Chloroflexota bacterium]
MQPINFFDDPEKRGRPREEVRLKQLGLYVYEDARRVAIGFNLTPFAERPSLEVTATNEEGKIAGSMTVIEALSPNFNITMHLRDKTPADIYAIDVVVFYKNEDGERLEVDRKQGAVDMSRPGEQIVG